MELKQMDFDNIKERVRSGEITIQESHVEQILMRRVLLVTCKIPREVRVALNAAVKTKKLNHLQKEGHKPEVYYHPNFDYLAKAERNAHAERIMRLSGCAVVTMSDVVQYNNKKESA